MQIELPPNFYWDHVARDLPAGTVVREKRKTLIVELDDDEAREILDDARHYAEAPSGYWEGIPLGLVSSARATVKRLVAAGVDSGASSHERAREIASQLVYVFGNPGEGYPLRCVVTASSEESARRQLDLPQTRDWPLIEKREPRP